jgi:hypothetical protein
VAELPSLTKFLPRVCHRAANFLTLLPLNIPSNIFCPKNTRDFVMLITLQSGEANAQPGTGKQDFPYPHLRRFGALRFEVDEETARLGPAQEVHAKSGLAWLT